MQSPEFVENNRLTFALRGARWVLGLCTALSWGCGEQEIPVIERAPAPVAVERGRVQVRDGALSTDKGTRLRGATLGIDAAPETELGDVFFNELTREAGLNTFHVYLENFEDETGIYATQADAIVEAAGKAGAYVILSIGGGADNGSFHLEKVRSFWGFYGPRYANRTHVIYEIQNIPEHVCDPLAEATLDMERETYTRIRAVAPSTHVVMFTFSARPSIEQTDAALDGVAGIVDWSKASIGYHDRDTCLPVEERAAWYEHLQGLGVASFVSEIPFGTKADRTGQLEQERSGWMNFDWIVQERDFEGFREAHEMAGVTWCPDFGSWPQDAERCTAP